MQTLHEKQKRVLFPLLAAGSARKPEIDFPPFGRGPATSTIGAAVCRDYFLLPGGFLPVCRVELHIVQALIVSSLL